MRVRKIICWIILAVGVLLQLLFNKADVLLIDILGHAAVICGLLMSISAYYPNNPGNKKQDDDNSNKTD